MDYKDAIEIAGVIATVASMWGMNKAQTKTLGERIEELKEAFRHHTESEHPRLGDVLDTVKLDVAVLKDRRGRTQSQVERDERGRR